MTRKTREEREAAEVSALYERSFVVSMITSAGFATEGGGGD